MEKDSKGSIAIVAIKLFLICFIATLILAGANMLTKDTIAQNDAEKFSESCKTVMPDAKEFKEADVSELAEKAEIADLKAAVGYDANGEEIGICVKQSVKGYNSGLVFMTGVTKDGAAVTGIEILEHSETPSLGAEATKPEFKEQFSGMKTPVELKKDGGEIQAITGATKTSAGIKNGVNTAVELAKEYFGEAAK